MYYITSKDYIEGLRVLFVLILYREISKFSQFLSGRFWPISIRKTDLGPELGNFYPDVGTPQKSQSGQRANPDKFSFFFETAGITSKDW